MKQNRNMQKWFASAVLGLLAAGAVNTAIADQDLATFDVDISANDGIDGTAAISAGATRVWSETNAPTGPAGGSLYVTLPWADIGGGWQEIQLNFTQPGWPGTDSAGFINLECDIKIDRANSFLGTGGNYGFARGIMQSWSDGSPGWAECGDNITLQDTDAWQHCSWNLSIFSGHATRVVLRLGGQNLTNNVRYWVDNLKLTSPPVPPPTLGNIEPATTPGLTLIPAGSSQYQRVMVLPNPTSQGSDYGWYGKPGTVTYSFTLTNFPTVNDFAANVFLIPNAHMQSGPIDTAVDWNCTNGLFLNFTANGENPATNWNVGFGAKSNVVQTADRNANVPLVNFNYSQFPTGTWALAFDNNTNITITAPNGYSTNFALTTELANLVSGNDLGNTALTPYIGIMPRTTTHIGKATVLSRIKIQGVPNSIDDSFATFDTNVWSKLADAPSGIFVNNGDVMGYLPWNTPNDQGFTSLIAAGAVVGPYKEIGAPSSKWILVNGVRKAVLSKSGVNSALGGAEANAAFFRLVKRAFSKLQVLMPGETAAPGTPTGKTGTPTPQTVGQEFEITVRSVDADWYPISAADSVNIQSSTDPLLAFPPFVSQLVGGTVNIPVTFGTAGNQTITVYDVTDPTKTANTSSQTAVVNP